MTETNAIPPSPAAARAARAETIKIIATYVRTRLVAETEGRGAVASLATKTGFTPSAIAQVRQGKNAPGEELCRAMAEHWGLTYAELETAARAALNSATESSPPTA